MSFQTPYFNALREQIRSLGGMDNAHLHLDRSGTLVLEHNVAGDSHLSLGQKHHLIRDIHAGPMYDPDKLKPRVAAYLDAMVAAGTRRACTLVDVTTDRVQLSALEVFLSLKEEYADRLELRIGAYSPLGFRDDEPERWELLEEAALRADFLGSLPERDDQQDYPEHIGFQEHIRRIVGLARRLDKTVHIHVDQRNDVAEHGAELALDALAELGPAPDSARPRIWFVHLISPSCYPEDRFQVLLETLKAQRVGVICCPSAALSMRQLRPLSSPTGNCIARVLDLLAAGIPVRVGSDNICDITSPAATPDLLAEMYVLLNAIRFYDLGVAAKLATGLPLDEAERSRVVEHLAEDLKEVQRVIGKFDRPASP